MNQPITQDFAIEIRSLGSDVTLASLFPVLAASVKSWEREFPDEDPDDSEANSNYLTEDTSEDDEDDAADDDEDEDEGEDENYTVEESSDSTLNLIVPVTPEVLADIRDMQALNMEERLELSIIYGTVPHTFVRKFTISPDVATSLSSGTRSSDQLKIEVIADVYDSETLF